MVLTSNTFAQNTMKNIQKKGTITITQNGVTKEYLFDLDSTLMNTSTDLNEILENLNISVSNNPEDSIDTDIIIDKSASMARNDTTAVKIGNGGVMVVENGNKTKISVGKKDMIKIEDGRDTVSIKIGGKIMRVVENKDGSIITFDDSKNDKEDKKENKEWSWDSKKHDGKFNGHYGLIESGLNTFTDPDYSMYSDDQQNFMDLDHNRSSEFNLNIFWTSVGLQKNKGNIGLITGLGFSWNNYFFSKDITLVQGDEMVEPLNMRDNDNYGYIDKTKLVVSYLTVPVLIEFQIPTKNEPLYVSVGAIGGIKLGSHTKVKHGGNKDKDSDDFYLSPFKYGATARLGYGSIYLYGTYNFSEVFKADRGPAMNPYTVGIGFPAF